MPKLDQLPLFLSRLTWVDFRGPGGLNDAEAFRRLISGIRGIAPGREIILGEGPDEIYPYQGLNAFDESTARFFFGREKVITAVLTRLERSNFVPLIGASGSGKSSIVRAGVIPALKAKGWRVLDPITPWIEPMTELKRRFSQIFTRVDQSQRVYELLERGEWLRAVHMIPGVERILVVVDQFEEVFTVCPPAQEDARQRFITLLTEVGERSESRLAVVITMRADFLESCLRYPTLAQLIQDHNVLIPALSGADLQRAILQPAQLQGYTVGEGLLELLLADINREQHFLPLLQFALTELWHQRHRQSRTLTLAHYQQIGGLLGALNRHANQIYQEFSPEEREFVRRICLRLVRTGTTERDTRQRQPKQRLLEIGGFRPEVQQAVEVVVDQLVRGRLLVTGGEPGEASWVDLAHEALMEQWELFATWRQSNRDLRRLGDRITDALTEWQKDPRDENLMMGGLLAQVRERWNDLEPELTSSAKVFYQQSDTYERQITTLRTFTKSTLQECADRVQRLLSSDHIEAEALVLAIRTIGLNLENWQGEVLEQVKDCLQSAVERVPEKNRFTVKGSVASIDLSPDGRYLAAGISDGTIDQYGIRLWDVQGDLITERFSQHNDRCEFVKFTSDSRYIRPVRPFLRRFRRNGAQPGVER
jgi:hypothetical protein